MSDRKRKFENVCKSVDVILYSEKKGGTQEVTIL